MNCQPRLIFKAGVSYTDRPVISCSMALPLVAWSFGGIESTTMAAFEARSVKDIAWASSSIHWITFLLYLFFAISVMLTIPWDSSNLASIYSRATGNITTLGETCGLSQIAVVVALCNSNSSYYDYNNSNSNSSLAHHYRPHPELAGFANGCLLYNVLSAGNTALYLASRTLYGLASSPRLRGRGYIGMLIRSLGTTNPRTGVPVHAVVFSWLILCWVPLLAFHDEPWNVLDGESSENPTKPGRAPPVVFRDVFAPNNLPKTPSLSETPRRPGGNGQSSQVINFKLTSTEVVDFDLDGYRTVFLGKNQFQVFRLFQRRHSMEFHEHGTVLLVEKD